MTDERETFKNWDANDGTRPTTPPVRLAVDNERKSDSGGATGETPNDKGAKGVPLVLRATDLCDPTTIPPREWLYGTQLVRGFVTVLVAPGGTGKTAYAMVVAAALASGRDLLGEHVFERMNVAVLNLEDPMAELDRRLAAIRIRYGLGPDDLTGRYFMHSGEDRPVTMAAFDEKGFAVEYPDEDALVSQILANNIGVIIVDPFAESHSLEENSNPQMVKAAASWRRVARRAKCAVLLVHHVRKGPTDGIDSARGAKALTDSARIGLLLSPMSAEDAADLGVAEQERTYYLRLDNAKANMAPRAGRAKWFKHCEINLGNGRGLYPNGDWVGAVEPWAAPEAFDNLSSQDCNRALDIIAAGPEPGALFSKDRRGGSGRWAGSVLVQSFERTDGQAKAILTAWLKTGLLVESFFTNKQRHDKPGVRVNDAKRPT